MMLQPENIPDSAVNGVLALAHHAGGRDWVPATSGNFSVRLNEHECAVTASGGDKGVLERSGIIRARLTGEAHPRASAEAPLHYALYRLSPEIGAVAHVHATSGVLASMLLASDGSVRIHGLEMLKAFRGYKSHEATMDVPVFDNDQDMDGLATRVENALAGGALPWGFLLAGHGLYAWGRDEKETLRHLDAFDYLFTLMLRLKGIPA
jgi:methylthioribulose-1-phosphate dehydratase